MDNFFGFLGAYYLIPSLIIGMIGFLLGWFLKPSQSQAGDLSIEGEGALRAEADSLRGRVQDMETRIAARDHEVSDLKAQLATTTDAPVAAADVTAKTTDADDTYALEWQNRYLAARVKYLDSRLADMSDDATAKKTPAKKTPAQKTAAAKKPAAKTAAAKTKAAPKAAKAPKTKALAATRETAVTKTNKAKPATAKAKSAKTKSAKTTTAKTAKKTASPKTAPKATSGKAAAAKTAGAKTSGAKKTASKEDAAFDRYYEKVKVYDARASRKVVQNIVDYCGISLKSRDSSLVACTDEAELRRVANGFVTKKLGIEDGQMELVKSICEQMKDQRLKSRVTFYYLTAKKARKLGLFR